MEKSNNAFNEEIIEGKGMLCILDHTGDTKLIWDPANETEVETAEETFKRLTKKGFAAFSVTKKGGEGEQIKEFDPKAGKIILIPPIVGG